MVNTVRSYVVIDRIILMFIVANCLFTNSIVLGVENSFHNPKVRKRFYQKYYQMLLHMKFPMKERKLCLVGPPDSGFCPFQGLFNSIYLL